jgi:hypothetical protein
MKIKYSKGIRHNSNSTLRNEKGLALVMVLVLSLIALTIISTLIFMVTQGTKVSGFYKRYATSLDAGYGGAEIATSLIFNRGNLVIPSNTTFFPTGVNYPTQCVCAFDADPTDEVYPFPSPDTCLCRKLCMPPYRSNGTYNWGLSGTGVACPADSASMDAVASPDMQFRLTGTGTDYQVSAKIVDTTIGVTDLSGELLSCGTPTTGKCETIGTPAPYLYRIEVNTQSSASSAKEKSRLSVLYAY